MWFFSNIVGEEGQESKVVFLPNPFFVILLHFTRTLESWFILVKNFFYNKQRTQWRHLTRSW
jgi:hypothetical protein